MKEFEKRRSKLVFVNYAAYVYYFANSAVLMFIEDIRVFNVFFDVMLALIQTSMAVLVTHSMHSLQKMGKPLEKLKIYADTNIYKYYAFLWSLAGICAVIQFIFVIPVTIIDDEGSETYWRLKIVQTLAFTMLFTCVVCMDLMILTTFLRYGK